MKAFILGVLVGFLIIFGTIYYYFRSGSAPVATSAGAMPFERWIASTALHARLAKEAPKDVPLETDEPNLLAGAGLYKDHCAICHGLPNQTPSPIAKGEFPKPPQLFAKDEMVTDDPPGVTFWKIENGIRLSGMPGFGSHLSHTQIWQIALLLAHADKLSPAVMARLKP